MWKEKHLQLPISLNTLLKANLDNLVTLKAFIYFQSKDTRSITIYKITPILEMMLSRKYLVMRERWTCPMEKRGSRLLPAQPICQAFSTKTRFLSILSLLARSFESPEEEAFQTLKTSLKQKKGRSHQNCSYRPRAKLHISTPNISSPSTCVQRLGS